MYFKKKPILYYIIDRNYFKVYKDIYQVLIECEVEFNLRDYETGNTIVHLIFKN